MTLLTGMGVSAAEALVGLVPASSVLPPVVPEQERVLVPLAQLSEACGVAASSLGGSLATMVGLDDREHSGGFRLVYVFAVGANGAGGAGWLSIEALVDPARPAFPSVTPILPAAHWYEREVRDLLGLEPEGHPDPRRLVLHEEWPAGHYPLRKDFDPSTPPPRLAAPMEPFHRLRGDGIVEIPVGPIHAGVIEPGHFRFAAVGEVVLHLEARLFYTHRGLERTAEGKSAERVLQIAERTCGVCAVSHAVSYCQAVEGIAGVTVPPRAAALRTIFLELERLYNHVGDLGNMCAGVGFAVGAMHGARLKDALQRLNERLTGHRFLRGVCRLGGVRRDLDAGARHDLLSTLDAIEPDFRRFVELFELTDPFQERLTGTGILSQEVASLFGAVGVAARASGIDRDARRDHPYASYAGLPLAVHVRRDGDVRARARVRVAESRTSFALVRAAERSLPDGPLSVPLGLLPAYRAALGLTESPRGENVHWVRTGPDGTIDRYRIRSASFCNWPVVPSTVPGNMVPDFPLINKSFELLLLLSGSLTMSMLTVLRAALKSGRVTTSYPAVASPVPPTLRGAPAIDPARCDGGGECVRACPADAITLERAPGDAWTWQLDLAPCVFCELCVDACPSGALSMSGEYELAVRSRQDLLTIVQHGATGGSTASPMAQRAIHRAPTADALADRLAQRVRSALRRSLHIRHMDAGSDNSTDWEANSLLNPVYDMQRLGIDVVASPRHADLLFVTGPVTRNLASALRRTYEAMPRPAIVVAAGAEACGGGVVQGSYAHAGGVDRVLPVDVYIPGDPPRPEAIIFGLLLAIDRVEQKRRAVEHRR